MSGYRPGSSGYSAPSPAWNRPPERRLYDPPIMPGEVARAERKTIPLAAVYICRGMERSAENRPIATEKYDRGQNLNALAGTGGVLALVGVFAGKPDVIDLAVTGGAAVVELQDRLGLNAVRFTVPAGAIFSTQVSRERVMAFNVSDASAATVSATGKWALYAPAVEGYRRADADEATITELGLATDPEGSVPRY